MSCTEWIYVTWEMETSVHGAAGRLPNVDFLDLTKTSSGHSNFSIPSLFYCPSPCTIWSTYLVTFHPYSSPRSFLVASQPRPHWDINLGATVMWYGG